MQQFLMQNQWVIFVAVAWTLAWKGLALWKAAKTGAKGWFVVMMVVNTLGILEILYLYIFSEKEELPKNTTIA